MNLSSFLLDIIKKGTYLIFLSPLIFGFSFFFPFVAPKGFFIMLISQIIFFAWLALIFINPSFRPKKNYLFWALFLFILSLIISTIFSVFPSISFWSNSERMTGLLFFFHLFAFFLVISSVLSKKDFENIFFFIVLVGIVFALSSFFVSAGNRGGTLGNESFWGTSLIFVIFFNLYLYFESQGVKKTFLLFSIIFFFFILIFSPARAAKVALVLGMILFFLLYLLFFSKKKILKYAAGFFLFCFFLFGFFAFVSLFFPDSFVRHLLTKFTDPTFGGRFIVWKAAWNGFLERPIVGWGLETFEVIFIKYFNPCVFSYRCGGEVWYDRAHNIFFDLLANAGLLGVVSFLLVFLASLYLLYLSYKKTKEQKTLLTILIFFSLFFAYFLQGMTVFDMPVSYLFLFTSFGFLSVLSQPEEKKKKEERKINPFYFIFLLCLFIFSFYYFIFLPVQVNKAVLRCLAVQKSNSLSYCQEVLRSPFGRFHNIENLATFLLPSDTSDVLISLTNKRKLEFVAEQLEKNLASFPEKFRTHYFLVRTYRILASYDLKYEKIAQERIDRLVELYPNHQLPYLEKFFFLMQENKEKEAFKVLEQAEQLEPDSRYLKYILQQLRAQKKD